MGEMSEYSGDNSYGIYYMILMTFNVITLAAALAACACCKRKFPKRENELLGLEGMVKLKNPDEVIVVTTGVPIKAQSESQADLNLSTISNADSEKRASTAAHRSLPDIPVTDDNGSELYETVADKQLVDAQNQHDKTMSYLKKQSSVSQHSSISQADDSPYSRVKNSPHGYAKVRGTEHPYAQLNAPPSNMVNGTTVTTGSGGGGGGTAAAAAVAVIAGGNVSSTSVGPGNGSIGTGLVPNSSQLTLNDSLHRSSHHSDSSHNVNDSATESQVDIPAASAIAGMVSASQDLPYMTPPINNQHFSGDSQDSSKGYTSISVREPLANILAQQPIKIQRIPPLSRDVNDSHYATVSDDSDETYAAIEDPTSRNHPMNAITAAGADIYTSGSETYAQIQPMQNNSIVVSVEINNISGSGGASSGAGNISTNPSLVYEPSILSNNRVRPNSEHAGMPIPPPVDNLRAHMHSRQASSASNVSCSVGNLGSPKPEKRQANSPLPPTPKSTSSTLHNQQHTTSSSNLTSGRNSVISVIELLEGSNSTTTLTTTNEGSPQKKTGSNHKSLSPSKDIEGMYAKVMKKSKFSRHSPSSQDNSPILSRKYEMGVTPLNATAAELLDSHKINVSSSSSTGNGNVANNRLRSNSYGSKDHGYETIPANASSVKNANSMENRKSDCYTNILQKERQLESGQNYTTTCTRLTTTTSSSIGGATGIVTQSANHPQQPNEMFFQAGLQAQQQQPHLQLQRQEKHYETIRDDNDGTAMGRHIVGLHQPLITDPGYETLQSKLGSCDPNDAKKSDYDPNYEVLKDPQTVCVTDGSGLSDDGYAKVSEKRHNDDDDSTDGYSKLKGEDNDSEAASIAGYSTIKEAQGIGISGQMETDSNHNYASILETKQTETSGGLILAVQVAGGSDTDHYTRISENPGTISKSFDSGGDFMKSSKSLSPVDSNMRPPELRLLISPNTTKTVQHYHSNYQINSISSSSANVTPSSTCTTLSSRQTPSSSSQYESFTGSDTDPNYECVSYVSKSAINTMAATPTTTSTGGTTPTTHSSPASDPAYERLQTDDYTQGNNSSSLNTPEDTGSPITASNTRTPNSSSMVSSSEIQVNVSMASNLTRDLSPEVVVDDYFHV